MHPCTPDNQTTHVHAQEMWRAVPGHEGWYSVSDQGRVRSEPRLVPRAGKGPQPWPGVVLRPMAHHKTGYLQVKLHRSGDEKWRLIHLLVLEAFVGPRPAGMQGAHENGRNTDNRLANLSWKTPSGNALDKVRHGTHAFASRDRCPRGHLLIKPNLVQCLLARGYRDCLSCNRARTTRSNKRKRQGIEIDWIPLAHANYADLMGEQVA